MKKLISLGGMILSLLISMPIITEANCTSERNCGGAGTIKCSGGNCTGSRPLASNPWVKCDGVTNYCYGDPTP